MTRRDYCAVCSEMVGDCDPMCCECNESFCFDCPTACDELSMLCLINAKIEVNCDPILTEDELKRIVNINSERIAEYCITTLKSYSVVDSDDKLQIVAHTIKTNFEKMKQQLIILNDEELTNDNNEHNIKMFSKFVRIMSNNFLELSFTCKMCFNNTPVVY